MTSEDKNFQKKFGNGSSKKVTTYLSNQKFLGAPWIGHDDFSPWIKLGTKQLCMHFVKWLKIKLFSGPIDQLIGDAI